MLAVPRHKLGDEVVADFAAAGTTAHVFRGREAYDPEAPGEKMCRDLERVREIEGALGRASTQACKSKKGQCEFFNVCGYQKQRQQQPEVWAVAHQLLFRQRPSFIELDALAIDEGFYSAALHGIETRYEIDLDLLIKTDRTVPNDAFATNELTEVSRRVHRALAAQPEGRVSRGLLERAYINASTVNGLHGLEWRRKIKLEIYPGMPVPSKYKAECARVQAHNQLVAKLGRFWRVAETDDSKRRTSARHGWSCSTRPARAARSNIIVAMVVARRHS